MAKKQGGSRGIAAREASLRTFERGFATDWDQPRILRGGRFSRSRRRGVTDALFTARDVALDSEGADSCYAQGQLLGAAAYWTGRAKAAANWLNAKRYGVMDEDRALADRVEAYALRSGIPNSPGMALRAYINTESGKADFDKWSAARIEVLRTQGRLDKVEAPYQRALDAFNSSCRKGR